MSTIPSKSLATLGAAVLVAGCATLGLSEPDERWADYKSWTRVNEEPSTGNSPGLGTVHKGPEGYRVVYVNDVGRDVILGDGPYEYPLGTVIVKEQYDDRAAYETGDDPDVTVSLKVGEGSADPKADWHWSDSYTGKAGDNAFCAGCHSIPIAEDFVFSNAKYLAAN